MSWGGPDTRRQNTLLLYAGVSISMLMTASSALAQVSWTGAADDDFSNGANWDTGSAPGAFDQAIMSDQGNPPVVGGAVTVQFLWVPTGGTLSVGTGASLSAVNQIYLSGTGTISGNGELFAADFAQFGGSVASGLVVSAGTFNAQAGTFAAMLTGDTVLTKATAGTFTFSGQLTAGTGSVTVNAGTFQLNGSVSNTIGWTVDTGAQLELLTGGGDVSMKSLTGGGTIVNNAASAKNLGFDNGSGDFSGVLADGTSVLSVSKSTGGTQILSGANTYSGNTTVSGGTLQVSHVQGLGNTTGSTSVTEAGTLVLDGVAIGNEQLFLGGTLAGTGTASWAGDITVFSAPTVQVDSGNSLLLSGNVTSGGAAPQSLTKTGAGTLTVTGNVAHTGGTTISAGTLQVGNGGTTGTLSGNVANAGTLDFNRSDASTFGGAITGAGTVIKSGTGTLTLTGNVTHTGGTTINGSTLQVGNGGTSGTLSGTVVNAGTLAFNRSDASTFDGAITGAGNVTKSGAGTLSLTGNATHTGGTTISAGTLQVGNGGTTGALSGNVANSGTLAFNRSDATTYSGVISGTGAVTKSGAGTLVLSGTNTYSGATTLNAGTLSVNGSIASSALTVNGGMLNGSGTLGATTINAGTLAAGNSIGTLNVAGALNLGAASVLQVEVSSGGNTLGVHSDLVAVNGSVTINPSATVQVRPVNGTDDGKTFASDTTYTIITSTGLTGTFASVAEDFAFLDASLSYDPNNAYLTLKRNETSLASVAATSNQTGAANALAAFAPGSPVANALLGLSAADAKRAYELASGDSHASGQAVLDQTFGLFQGAMGGGSGGGSGAVMSYLDAGAGLVGAVGSTEPVVTPLAINAVWLTPMAGRGVIDNDGNGATTEWAAGGLAAGYERRSTLAGGDVVAGLGVGYTIASADTPTRLSRSNAQGGQFGLYGEWTNVALALSGSLSYGANHISSKRDIVIGALTSTANAQYWMQGVDAKFLAGYGYELVDGFKVGPMAGLALGWSGHGGFSETGAGALNATLAASSTWRVESALGVEFAYELEGQDDSFKISGRALWLHNFGDNVTTSTVTLAGGGAPFTVVSPTSGRDRLELGAGLAWSASGRVTLSTDYTGRFFGGQTDHIAKAGLTLNF